MKKLFTFLAIGSVVMLLHSCTAHRSDANSTVTVTPTASMTAIVGTHTFSATGTSVSSSITNDTSLSFGGVSPSYESITLSVVNFKRTPATYVIDSSIKATVMYGSSAGALPKLSYNGSITFTSVSPNLEGTFHFVLSDSTNVTSGTFKVKAPY